LYIRPNPRVPRALPGASRGPDARTCFFLPLLRCSVPPPSRLLVVVFHTQPLRVHATQIVLRICVPLICCSAIPICCPAVRFPSRHLVGIKQGTEIELGFYVAIPGAHPQTLHDLCLPHPRATERADNLFLLLLYLVGTVDACILAAAHPSCFVIARQCLIANRASLARHSRR